MISQTLRSHARKPVACALAGATAVALGGCATAQKPTTVISTPKSTSPYDGTVLDRGFAKPTATFTSTDDKKFDIAKDTRGKATLVYFGYTHCPDVCPTTMADLGLAVKRLPKSVRKKVRVLFVTSDPHRDTPKRMRAWLNSFDTDFTGLTASWPTIATTAKGLGVGLDKPVVKGGDYQVTHGAQVLAYPADGDTGRILYTQDATSADYGHDIPLLVRGVKP
jgi:protein SCO1/2